MLYNGVNTYVPACARVSANDANVNDALQFNPVSWDYYKEFVPSVLPGVILGGLAAFAFLFFLIWLCVQAARLKNTPKDASPRSQDQFVRDAAWDQGGGAPPRSHSTHGAIFLVALVLFALATIGLSAWGMAESIRSTDTQIPEFWDIVDEVQGVVQGINGSLAGITSSANQLEPILDSTQGAIVPLLQGLADDPALQAQFPQFAPLANAQSIATIRQALSGASAHLQSVVAGLNSAENLVQNKILPTLQSAVDEVEPPTMAFQNRWRYIPIAVLFGVLIVLAALLALTLPRMRWYKTASALTAVAWLDIALVMLLGVGILRGIYEVSGDVCLYGETYVYDRTSAALDGDAQGVFQRAWWYYTGNGTLPEATYFDVITGTPVSQVLDTIEQPEVVELLLAISNITSAQLQAAGVQGPLAQDILQLPGLITPLAGDIADVLRYASLDTIQPIYVRVKGLLCCELGSRSYDVWVAWTAAGCVAFVFALLASARVVSHTVIAARKLQDQGLRGAELYPGDGAPPYGVYNPGDAPAWGMPGADGRPHGAMGKL